MEGVLRSLKKNIHQSLLFSITMNNSVLLNFGRIREYEPV